MTSPSFAYNLNINNYSGFSSVFFVDIYGYFTSGIFVFKIYNVNNLPFLLNY